MFISIRIRSGFSDLRLRNPLLAIARQDDFKAPALQSARQRVAVLFVVFYD